MEDTTKCTIICDPCPVTTVAAVTPGTIPIEGITEDFLIQMMDESVENLNAAPAQSERKIFKVPDLLRMNGKNAKSFDPEVVAIGPYHRGKPHLEPMEDHKRAAARKFISCSGHSAGEFYDKVKDVAGQARTCYAAGDLGLSDEEEEEEFTLMLLFDGCFVLHFIEQFVEGKTKELTVSNHLHGFIERDMFLLENQLPPIVFSALMSLKPVKLSEFLSKITELYPKTAGEVTSWLELLLNLPRTYLKPPSRRIAGPKSTGGETSCPDQLLNLLRMKYLNAPSEPKRGGLRCACFGGATASGPAEWHSFRSVKELREIGIKFRRSRTNYYNDIEFHPCVVWGKLSLPKIVVDDLTQSQLLNMIALEMHLGSEGGYGITSFVWFLDCLIDRADDVRELRDAGILLNALGSDEQVAELFNELATNLAPDYRPYEDLLSKIATHRKNRVRVSIYRFLHTHFSSPWTAIAFIAAVFLLAMSVIQTIFAVFPRS